MVPPALKLTVKSLVELHLVELLSPLVAEPLINVRLESVTMPPKSANSLLCAPTTLMTNAPTPSVTPPLELATPSPSLLDLPLVAKNLAVTQLLDLTSLLITPNAKMETLATFPNVPLLETALVLLMIVMERLLTNPTVNLSFAEISLDANSSILTASPIPLSDLPMTLAKLSNVLTVPKTTTTKLVFLTPTTTLVTVKPTEVIASLSSLSLVVSLVVLSLPSSFAV
jgi:hypothetical protein